MVTGVEVLEVRLQVAAIQDLPEDITRGETLNQANR